jgi:hypothetical protein
MARAQQLGKPDDNGTRTRGVGQEETAPVGFIRRLGPLAYSENASALVRRVAVQATMDLSPIDSAAGPHGQPCS